MSNLTKYLLFTFITIWILVGIGCYSGNFENILPLCMLTPTFGALLVKADIKKMGWDQDSIRTGNT